MPEFDENFSRLPQEVQQKVRKKLEFFKESPMQHIIKTSPMLSKPFAGIRHYSSGRMRLYFRICKECIQHNHYSIHWECKGCKKEEDLIILFNVQFRRDDTYERRLKFDYTENIPSSDFEL
jgi:mRNA-degrading endonuclease RelE of RelBE toxin-antitoxin system